MRNTLTAAIAAALLLAAALPAAAIAQTYSVQHTTVDASGNRVNEGANARVLGGDASTVTIEIECFVNTFRPALWSGVDACYIAGADGERNSNLWRSSSAPGSFSLATGLLTVPRQHYRVCVQGHGWFDDTIGRVTAPLVCSA